MHLTPQQQATLLAAVIANPAANAARLGGDSVTLLAWLNGPSATVAWKPSVTAGAMFDSLTISSFDNLTAGKRDAFRLMLDREVIDATKGSIRSGLADIFTVTGAYTDAQQLAKMLNGACTEFATNSQAAIGGTTPQAVGGVSALKRYTTETCDETDANWLINH